MHYCGYCSSHCHIVCNLLINLLSFSCVAIKNNTLCIQCFVKNMMQYLKLREDLRKVGNWLEVNPEAFTLTLVWIGCACTLHNFLHKYVHAVGLVMLKMETSSNCSTVSSLKSNVFMTTLYSNTCMVNP